MQLSIRASGFISQQPLKERVTQFCALQGWELSWLPAQEDDTNRTHARQSCDADIVFCDDEAALEWIKPTLDKADVLIVVFERVSETLTERLPTQGLELRFAADVTDHQLLDGITVAFNLIKFRSQFHVGDEAEPITKLPPHPELLATMSRYRHEPTGLVVMQIDHAEHLYANLDPVSKTDLLSALAEHIQQQLPLLAQMAIFDAGCFAVCVPEASRSQIRTLAEKMVAACRAPMRFRSGELHFTLSAGYAFAQALRDPQDLWQDAWQAKEAAHNEGGDRVLSAQSGPTDTPDIPGALEHNEFSLALQPQFDITGNELKGVESLLRWQGLEVNRLFPDHFIPVAERSGQMARVGDWVLENACASASTWLEQYLHPISLGINVSPQQFRQEAIYQQVCRLSQDKWLDPHALELELTHANLLHVVDRHRATLYQLRDMGVRIAIDNLGVDMIDTSKLLRCPADTLKIDRNLIAQIEHDRNARQLTQQICELGNRFNLRVVAVGIESEGQREMLEDMGCADGQGFLFAAPIAAGDFTDYMQDNLAAVAASS